MKIEDYDKYYIQGSDHYLIPKDEFNELFNEMVNWKEESKKQKEVIDEARQCIKDFLCSEEYINVDGDAIANNYKNILNILDKKEIQQKEFIKWLEDEIYNIEPNGTGINYNCEYDSEEDYVRAMQEQSRLNTLKEILQKYKEITEKIDNENND